MYATIIALSLVLTAASGFDKRECAKLDTFQTIPCCILPVEMFRDRNDNFPECHSLPANGLSCEYETCMAKKQRFAGPVDGTFNKTALLLHVNKEFDAMPNLTILFKQECIDSSLEEYGPFCDLVKVRFCLLRQFVKSCPEWDGTSQVCAGFKRLARLCQNKVSDDYAFLDEE